MFYCATFVLIPSNLCSPDFLTPLTILFLNTTASNPPSYIRGYHSNSSQCACNDMIVAIHSL
jgi:hypothetical protein